MSELKLKIKGRFSHDDCTLGRMSYGDYQCFTLELPWLNNRKGVSCIPVGIYKCKKIISPSLGECINVENVFGRTYIRIHRGNFTSQIEGCILVGKSIQFINDDNIPDVGSSGVAFEGLMAVLPDEFLMEVGI